MPAFDVSPDFLTLSRFFQVLHDGKMAFSLDGGKTKFPSLEHLVDFHRMNTGPLPNILKDSSFVSSTPPSPSGLKERNNNIGVDGLHQDLEQEVGQSSWQGRLEKYKDGHCQNLYLIVCQWTPWSSDQSGHRLHVKNIWISNNWIVNLVFHRIDKILYFSIWYETFITFRYYTTFLFRIKLPSHHILSMLPSWQ